MKKSLLSVILLFITWAVSATAICSPRSAIMRLGETVCKYEYKGRSVPDAWEYSTSYTYDRNANITSLSRQGITDRTVLGNYVFGLHSRYSMDYYVNQLSQMTIEREGADYEGRTGVSATGKISNFWYDPNGNLGRDMSHGILETRYNHDNLPTDVYFESGHRQTIEYDGFGQKRKVAYSQSYSPVLGTMMGVPDDSTYTLQGQRDYIGPHVFVGDSLEYSAFPGGYFTPAGVFYYITDWQGNNIAVFSDKGELVQQTTYYPYGEPTIEPQGQRYLFGGKEREHAGGRNSYDFGPRNLGPSGSWDSADRKATENYPISPFSYCNGDPINHIDNDGNLPIPVAMFLIGAGIDFTTQISLNIVKGQSFLQALGNVDGTSVLAAGVAGAFGIPGSSTSIKIGVSIINIADAAVDVKLNGEFEYVGGGTGHEKELAKAGIDLVANMIPDCWAKGLSPKAADASISTTGKAGKELSKKEQENAASIMFKTSGESLKVAIDNNKSKDRISNQEKYIAPTDAIKSINEPIHNIQINNEKLYRSIHNWP